MKTEKEIPIASPETEDIQQETPDAASATVEMADAADVVVNENDEAEASSECQTANSADVQADDPLEAQLAQAQDEIAALKDKNLRQMAEFDNFRKRTIKEKAELILNGGEKVINALLPVLDDFERALSNIEKSNDPDILRQGVELISSKLLHTLEAQGLSRIEAEGQEFNTDFHEAIALTPVNDAKQKGKVVDCVLTGYKLGDKVIRHAKVAVGQ